jgi:DMSO/TMAO reductase YedYZ molybdopterin-dependent catalytic subunit
MATRGFLGRKRETAATPLPPGQYLERGFPVLSAGPTPRTSLDEWAFALEHEGQKLASWTWKEFLELPQSEIAVDIHCVTSWSKLDTQWKGVSIENLLDSAGIEPPEPYAMAFCEGGYTTNLPVEDLLKDNSMVAFEYDGQPLEPEHGGPARLLIPHLYFWKSAKWVRGLRFMGSDEPGFWEGYGYHMYGDPWLEQRNSGD